MADRFDDPGESTTMRMITACTGCGGSPEFFTCTLHINEQEYDLGMHYDQAQEQAVEYGYEGPFVSFDEIEAPAWLFQHFYPNAEQITGMYPDQD
jgi:hypothetical protein